MHCPSGGAHAAESARPFAERTSQELVQQLGAGDYRVRQAAEAELLSRGVASAADVREALNAPNAEVRYRAERLIRRLQILVAAQNEQLLLSAPWQVQSELAAVWERWHAFVGDSSGSRQLLVQMLRVEPALLLAITQPRVVLQTAFEDRCGELRVFPGQTGIEVNPMTTAAVLFVALQDDFRPSPQAVQTVVDLVIDKRFLSLLNDPRVGKPVRGLIEQWIQHGGLSTPRMRLNVSQAINSPAGLQAAREFLTAANIANGQSFEAVNYLVKLGGAEGMEILETKLEDQTAVNPVGAGGAINGTLEVQVRDIALLGLIRMTRQNPAEYGFKNAVDGQYIAHRAGFGSVADREAAFTKWHAWSRENLRSVLPAPGDASEGSSL